MHRRFEAWLLPLILLAGTALEGCAAEDDEQAQVTTTAYTRASTSRERRLSPPVDVPPHPVIGHPMTEFVASVVGGRPPSREVRRDGCVYRDYDSIGVSYEACGRRTEILRVYARGIFPARVYADHMVLGRQETDDVPRDGLIDSYSDESSGEASYDRDRDGRVDKETFEVAKLPDTFTAANFDPACDSPPAREYLAVRGREDLDGDGRFETEWITAKWGSWWRCTE